MAPQTISHYEILEKLGEGGMGLVWKAHDTRLNRFVAIKTLPAGKVGDAERRRRFIQEAQAASALNHPNIVTIHEIASENDTDFIVMEYVDGKTLGQLIPRRGMRIEEVLRYAIQIAEALAKAHAAGIIHRDLKPGNIMVTVEGSIKLLDFGLAKLTEPVAIGRAAIGDDESTRTVAVHSDAGTIIGTAAYMSPEQTESKPVDARSDIFSFGAVLYEMVTGTRAFQGDSKLSTLSAVLRETPKPAGQVAPDIPRELDRIIGRCLRKDLARRFQAMPDLKVALQELKEENDSGTAEIAGGKLVLPTVKRRNRILLTAAAVLLVAAAGASWFVLHPASKSLPVMQSVPLTTYAGSESRPSFSPDGNQVAFQWNGEKGDNWDIYVKLVEGGRPLQLTTNSAPDVAPAWSPNGRQIVFIREGSGVYSVSPLGGVEQKLTDAHADGVAWMPDGESLLISSARTHRELHSIFRFSLKTGEMQRLTSPLSRVTIGNGDFAPAVSPNGRNISFLRVVNFTADLHVQPLAGGTPHLLVRAAANVGQTWANDREIIFSRGGTESHSLWRVAVDGRQDPKPVSGALDGADFPALAHPASGPARLAYERVLTDINVWRMEVVTEADGRFRTVNEPAAIIASTRTDTNPQFSPDGKRFAFVSNREGRSEIWVARSDGSDPVRLTMFNSLSTGLPRWSPDGRQIIFNSMASGNNDIWIIGSEGGTPKQVTTEPSNEARAVWSRDSHWIYFRSDRSGSQQIWRVPSSEPFQPAVQITKNGGFEGMESPNRKLLYYVKDNQLRGGLWSTPVEGGTETQVLQSVTNTSWAVADNGLYFFDFARGSQGAGTPLEFFSFSTNQVSRVRSLPGVFQTSPIPSLTVTQDGRWIAWTQVDHQDSDLMMIENFR